MNIVGKGLLVISCSLVVIFAGCSRKKIEMKYTPEQLAAIPAPQREDLPAPTGGLVLSVNGQTLAAEEVVAPSLQMMAGPTTKVDFQTFAKQASPHIQRIIKDQISTILLYQKAKLKLEENIFADGGPLDKAVDKEIKLFVASHGGDHSLAQEELQKDGFTWQSFREHKKKLMIAQSYFADKLADTETPSHAELQEVYNSIKEKSFKMPAKLIFSIIQVKKPEVATSTKEEILALAKNIKAKAQSGEDFEALVKEFSNGPKAAVGGIWETSSPDSLNTPYDIIAKEAAQLMPGQIGEIVENSGNYFVVKTLFNQKERILSFDEVHEDLEMRLVSMKRQQKAERLIYEMFQEANIAGIDGFISYCIRETYIRSR